MVRFTGQILCRLYIHTVLINRMDLIRIISEPRSSSMRKGRISADMISGPQGDLKHTGHVGPDGNFFGDLTFLGSKVRTSTF